MALVSCNACNRRHERPVNSKCIYLKAAVSRCLHLGVSTDNYKHYLPDIGSLPGTNDMDTTGNTPFPLLAEDVLALLQNNAECKKRLADTQCQLDQVLHRLDSLVIHQPQGVGVLAAA